MSHEGLAPSIRESSKGKTKTSGITKQGSSPWLRCWILVQCAHVDIKYYAHLRIFYDRIRNRRGHAKAIIVARATKELLVIIWYMLTRNELFRYMDKQKDMNKSYRN